MTLKIRTGWAADQRNAPAIARIAQERGIAALAVHGRTRDQQYTGVAEYDTIAADQGGAVDPGDRQRRHRFAAEGRRRAARTPAATR